MAVVQTSSTNHNQYVITGTIGFALGMRISSGVIRAPRPTIQTTRTLNGVTSTWASTATSVILEVSGSTLWETEIGVLSTAKTITLYNSGTEILTVGEPIFSNLIATASPVYTVSGTPPWTINTGQNKTFSVKYLGYDTGLFNEAIWFPTNEANSSSRYDLQVSLGNTSRLQLSPSYITTSTTLPNENVFIEYSASVLRNGIEQVSVDPNISSVSVSGSAAWSVESYTNDSFLLRFDASYFNDSSGTYVATVTAASGTPGLASATAVNTATHIPNYSLNYSTATWMSTLTQPDVIVGARIDYVQIKNTTSTQRTLTIGVGSGADGSPTLASGSYFKESYLNPTAGRGRIPFPYWQTVYQIPLPAMTTGTVRTFRSKDYRVKTQEPLAKDYDHYFGYYENSGTMFVIEQDINQNVYIKMNDVRETTNGQNPSLDATLNGFKRAFYYYSKYDEDQGTRYTSYAGPNSSQQVYENGQPVDTYLLNEYGQIGTTNTNCLYFLGFDRFNRIVTSLLSSPRS